MEIKKINSNLNGAGLKIGIAVARFNSHITEALLEGALYALTHSGVAKQDILISYVPGAFELPLAAQLLAKSSHAVICLGAVIQGGTPHFEYVCDAATQGILRVGLDAAKPVIFGVLTCDTLEQALERAGLVSDPSQLSATRDHSVADQQLGSIQRNKGAESAMCAIEMANLQMALAKEPS
jgi:6,7-dimethyl-8-ribityllumazine synthase